MINDGGPAFPCEGGDLSGLYAAPGMTQRDWYAGQALPALIARHRADIAWSDVAPLAFKIADAMLQARITNAQPT